MSNLHTKDHSERQALQSVSAVLPINGYQPKLGNAVRTEE